MHETIHSVVRTQGSSAQKFRNEHLESVLPPVLCTMVGKGPICALNCYVKLCSSNSLLLEFIHIYTYSPNPTSQADTGQHPPLRCLASAPC